MPDGLGLDPGDVAGAVPDSSPPAGETRTSALSLGSCTAISGTSTGATVTMQTPNNSPKLIAHPKVFFLWWGDYWVGAVGTVGRDRKDALIAFWSDMANRASFWRQNAEYGIGDGSYLGQHLLAGQTGTAAAPVNIPESGTSSIRSTLTAAIGTTGIPANDDSTIYIIMLPPNTKSQLDVDKGYDGHHDKTTKNSKNVWYGVVENFTTNMSNILASHEIYEAATDPDLTSGWRDAVSKNETGDLCNKLPHFLGGQTVQQQWSQALCGCLVSPADQLQLAYVHPEAQQMLHTVRLPTGYWDPLAEVTRFPTTGIADIDMTTVGGFETHTLLLTGGVLQHAIRDTNGVWTGFGNASTQMGFSGSLKRISGADVNNELNVCTFDAGQFYQGVRHHDGSWTRLTPLGLPGGTPPVDVDCAGDGASLHYVALASNSGNNVWHSLRSPSGTGTTFFQIPGAPPASAVSTTAIAGELHVLLVGTSPTFLYYGKRKTDGTWTTFQVITAGVVDVASAAVAGQLHVVAKDQFTTNTLFHAIQPNSGSWVFGTVNPNVEGSGGNLSRIAAAGGVGTF